MANISTDFIKINNEYVKFYATTNSALPNILKNTGALIVVQDNDSAFKDELGEPIRSLYIAKNFIAEGHGFSAYTIRDYYDSYAKIDENGSRVLSNILDSLKTGIDTNSSTFTYYVKIDGGPISETYINTYVYGAGSYTMETMYLTYLFKPAEYKRAVINTVESYITYNYGHSNNDIYSSYLTNGESLDYNNENLVRELQFDVPRGARICSTYLCGTSTNYDTRGFTSTIPENNSDEIPAADSSSFVIGSIDINKDNTGPDGEITVMINSECSDRFRNLEKFTAHNLGTTAEQIKKYPWLPSDIEHNSYENVIEPYSVNIGYVRCNIYDVIKYSSVSYDNITSSEVYEKDITNNSRIYDIDNDKNYAYALIDCSDFSTTSDNYIVLAVPDNYEILHVDQMKKYNRNMVESYYEYNVTGDTYELERSSSTNTVSLTTYYMTIPNYYCKCRYYTIKNNVSTTDKIYIRLRKKFVENDIVVNNPNSLSSLGMGVTSYFLQDSEYNSTHWMSPSELAYIQNII